MSQVRYHTGERLVINAPRTTLHDAGRVRLYESSSSCLRNSLTLRTCWQTPLTTFWPSAPFQKSTGNRSGRIDSQTEVVVVIVVTPPLGRGRI